jgi:ClpP class serine protease
VTKNVRPDVRQIQPREMLAIDSATIRARPEGFFWLWSPPARQTERNGSVAVVHVRGPLEHHDDGWGDSYDAICKRVEKALQGQDVVDSWTREQSWRSSPQPPECPDATPPSSVVLCIDSPGGVVAGLNETVAKLAKTARAAGIPLVAYVDEMAASAAYALACSCSEIVCPRSAILGSVGVISTMVDQTAADAEAGLRFVTITSGDRKADGHPHVPIEDEAIAAERSRVMQLAGQFWEIVAKSRGLSLEKIEGFQAAIFLGREAKKAGLADRVQGWDALLKRLNGLDNPEGTSSASDGTNNVSPSGERMNITALIKRTEAKIAAEKDPAKLSALYANLASYKKTEKHVEHTKTEEEEGEEDDADEAEEAKGNETDRGDDEKDDEDDDEDDDDAKKSKKAKSESEAGDDKKAMLAVYRAASEATGKSGRSVVGAIAALVAEAKQVPALRERVASIEAREKAAEKDNLIGRAKAERRITPAEAKTLASKKLDFVQGFLDMRPNALVATEDGELRVPSGKEHADLSADALKQIDQAMAAMPDGTTKEAKEAMKAKLLENARKAIAETNGAAVGRH